MECWLDEPDVDAKLVEIVSVAVEIELLMIVEPCRFVVASARDEAARTILVIELEVAEVATSELVDPGSVDTACMIVVTGPNKVEDGVSACIEVEDREEVDADAKVAGRAVAVDRSDVVEINSRPPPLLPPRLELMILLLAAMLLETLVLETTLLPRWLLERTVLLPSPKWLEMPPPELELPLRRLELLLRKLALH